VACATAEHAWPACQQQLTQGPATQLSSSCTSTQQLASSETLAYATPAAPAGTAAAFPASSRSSPSSKMFKLLHPRWDPVALHDYFNLVVIAILNVENMTYLATGKGFELFFTSAMVYFLLDTIFVGVYPQSVKSPVVILSHHICTALYMLIPYNYPHYQWCMAYCMLVEINTWLLIARRQLGGKLLEVRFC
jgi:hypothetical protein